MRKQEWATYSIATSPAFSRSRGSEGAFTVIGIAFPTVLLDCASTLAARRSRSSRRMGEFYVVEPVAPGWLDLLQDLRCISTRELNDRHAPSFVVRRDRLVRHLNSFSSA